MGLATCLCETFRFAVSCCYVYATFSLHFGDLFAFFATSLGQAWHEDTGLPFVYAVWAIRRDQCLLSLGQKLLQAKQDGLAKLDEIIVTHPDTARSRS